MSEKHDPTTTTPRGCERGEELVAYLYGEATKEATGLFRRHLDACAVCREELAALGGVRAGLGAWRAEALGSIPSLNIGEALAHATMPQTAAVRMRSARAALREFFSLSPLWLRAGAFAATLAVCALLALTLARAEVSWDSDGLAFRAGVAERIVKERIEVPVQSGYTDEQVNAIVAQKIAEAQANLADKSREPLRGQQSESVINVSSDGGKSPQQVAATNTQRRRRSTRNNARRDERLLAEDDLPRLSDLLNGSY